MAYKFHKNSSLRCTFIWHNAVCSFHFRSFQQIYISVTKIIGEMKEYTTSDEWFISTYIIYTKCYFLYFQEGLVIIDTPGFGDNRMHKSLKKYLTKSCGFIYVVNTANAGGVQRGRVSVVFLQICLCKWTWKKISANISTTRWSLFCILQSRKWLGINL